MCSASGKRSDQQLLHLAVAREDHERLVGGQEVLDPGERRARLAAAASRLSALSCASRSARSAAAIFASSSPRSSGCSRSHAITSSWASLYSRWLSSATGQHDLRLGRQLREHLGLQPPHEARAAQVPVDALLGPRALEAAGEARPGAELPAGAAGSAAARSAPPGGSSPVVPVSASRSAPSAAASASRRTACVSLARGF
jgi:hypothetical protein